MAKIPAKRIHTRLPIAIRYKNLNTLEKNRKNRVHATRWIKKSPHGDFDDKQVRKSLRICR